LAAGLHPEALEKLTALRRPLAGFRGYRNRDKGRERGK